MSSVIHLPWIGDRYTEGLHRKRVALIGYSHWLGDDWEDGADLTRKVVAAYLAGSNAHFFSRITAAFEEADLAANREDVWRRVAFFNFIPSIVGGPEQRYARGTAQQVSAGRQRFLSFLDKHAPETVVVFTTKGWRDFPDTEESARGEPLSWLDASRWPDRYDWGTYVNAKGETTRAYALKHPERANRDELAAALSLIFGQSAEPSL